jgi:hypothetical protein
MTDVACLSIRRCDSRRPGPRPEFSRLVARRVRRSARPRSGSRSHPADVAVTTRPAPLPTAAGPPRSLGDMLLWVLVGDATQVAEVGEPGVRAFDRPSQAEVSGCVSSGSPLRRFLARGMSVSPRPTRRWRVRSCRSGAVQVQGLNVLEQSAHGLRGRYEHDTAIAVRAVDDLAGRDPARIRCTNRFRPDLHRAAGLGRTFPDARLRVRAAVGSGLTQVQADDLVMGRRVIPGELGEYAYGQLLGAAPAQGGLTRPAESGLPHPRDS